jgi:hypothetical protein
MAESPVKGRWYLVYNLMGMSTSSNEPQLQECWRQLDAGTQKEAIKLGMATWEEIKKAEKARAKKVRTKTINSLPFGGVNPRPRIMYECWIPDAR